MKKILITILAVLGMACSAFGQGIIDPRNITHTGSNTFSGELIGKNGLVWQNPANATNFTWTSNGKEVTLTSYKSAYDPQPTNDVIIPDMLDGLPVTGFGIIFSPETYGSYITSISGGANIQSVAFNAFINCDDLKTVNLHNLRSIGSQSFYECNKLEYIEAPSLTNVELNTFLHCYNLTNISLENVTTIKDYGFYGCTNLQTVYIPKVTNIGSYAFALCDNLVSITLSQNAPPQNTSVYTSTILTNYIINSTATGWGDTWNGKPVVRLPLYGSGIVPSGASYTNWTGLTSTYLSSSTGTVVDAMSYNKFIMQLETNLVMCAPTNAVAGRSLQWSITASGADRTVVWPTNLFKIPTSSTMANVIVVSNNTESIFVIEYRTNTPNWKLETYVWGY